jgi:trimeric autotransporter adhesin
MRSFLWILLLLLGACGGGGSGGSGGAPQVNLTSIAVTPANPATPVGVPTQFKATGTYSDGSSRDITSTVAWSSATPSVATVVAASGLASAVAAGTSAITATSGTVSASTTLTVNGAALQSIAVTPANPSITVGQTAKFTATGNYSDGTSHDITSAVIWSSGTTSVASLSASGTATGVAPGTSLITATQKLVLGSTTLTVTPAVLLSIGVTPVNPTLAVPQSIQLTATGTYSDGTTRDLSSFVGWTSANGSVASITGNGVAAALTPGATLVTAAIGAVSGATTVTVTHAVLQSIAVTPANPAIPVGHTRQFIATGSYSDGTFQNLSATANWSSGTTAVATVDGSGLASGVSAGVATITAAVGAVSGHTDLTVNAVVLQSIAVTPTSPGILVGGSQQFTATGTYSDTSSHDLTSSATWSSGATSVATINSGGLASGIGAGSSTITATSSSISGTATLTVAAPVTDAVTPGARTLGSAGGCTGGVLTATFNVAAASGTTWTAVADTSIAPQGGATVQAAPSASSGSGSVLVTVTVPPQVPSAYSSCTLTYTIGTFTNVYVTFSDGTVIGVTVYWTFIGVT